MAADINSREFAEAWRLVSETLSETLLQYVRSRCQPIDSINRNGADVAGAKQNQQSDMVREREDTPHPPVLKQEGKTKTEERYAACPVRQQDGSYILKNLKEERQNESTFKIIKYSDGTCDIELCDLQGEARQIFKDTKSERMPSAVGTVIGDITADKRIVTTKVGKGEIVGRSVKVIEPLVVEFQ